ncbi:hypothetical protein B9Z55_004168 [Caenorhabditis nigoni]|uniref:Uncharacterized protein n=1 Tax=Caenorhabditis nigoni TaxID=1611254 RepID=A0A2G5UVZ5_9PELO|nr:hypothetical protein B9Z55_004168 [Caenorhabditis nigoni]
MSGRGEEGAAKGGTTPPRSYLDHRHRGRGRPRKYPLAGLPRMPTSSSSGAAEDVVMDSEEFRQEDVAVEEDSEVYFPDDVVDEEVVVAAEDTVEDTVEEEDQDTVDPVEMEKIKQIQHQKMQLVTPMAQKRLRGRPPVPRGDTDDFQDEDVDEEMLMLDDKDPQNPEDVEHPEDNPDGPPPAPRHLVNKQNSRGRPANPIPPHRRPLPKDLVPPGVLKRGAPGERGGAKRRALLDEAPPLLHPPRGGPVPSAVPEEAQKTPEDVIIKTEEGVIPAPEAVEEVVVPAPSEDVAAQKKGGLDLPAEHFPKNAAGHVATRGIHPIAAEKLTTMFEILEEEDVGEVIVGRGEDSEAQQRVLTLQGGSFIEDRIGRADLMEDEETRMMQKASGGATSSGEAPGASYITVQEEDGRNVVYHVAEGENAEEYVLEEGPQMKEELMDEEDDDDLPPELIPEGVADDVGDVEMGGDKEHDGGAMGFEFSMMDDEPITLHSPNGGPHAVRIVRDEQGNQVFVDENGLIVELITDTGAYVDPSTIDPQVQLQLQMGGEESKMMKTGDGEVKGEQENGEEWAEILG